jgi:signal transduction histidine kinase
VVETVIQEFSKEATEKGVSINLETRVSEEAGDCFIDKDLIAKALFYILENGIEAVTKIQKGKKSRSLKVAVFGDEGSIGITISDRGEGIPKKNKDRIFEPFFSTRPDRVGLGLTFAKKVVGDQGGDIQVDSRLKRGTTITLTFPKDRRRMVRQGLISPEVKFPISSL